MKVDVVESLSGNALELAWELYERAFRGMDGLAVQRHLMHRGEFDDVAGDRRVLKYCALDDDGTLCGLATYTNVLDAMPLISPAYFARRWPKHYAEGRVWYCGFVAVDPTGNGAFPALVAAMYERADAHAWAGRGWVAALDLCRHNAVERRLDRAIASLLRRISAGRVRAEPADAQTYWVYETVPRSGS